MIADSSKPNIYKLRNVYTIGSTERNVTIQKRNVYYMYIKIKVIAFIMNLEETNPFAIEKCKKVQVGNDQEKGQSERDSHSENRVGKKPNQHSGTYTMKTYTCSKSNEQLFFPIGGHSGT